MVANKDYWRGAPLIDEVVFTAYLNPDAMVQDLRSGAIDACWGVPEGQFAPLGQTAGFKAVSYVVKGFDELGFNCYTGPSLGNPLVKDWRFRQALNWAIDKQQLVKIAYAGYAVPGDTLIVSDFYTNPDWHWQPPPDQLYGYDPAKATQLLADAGYKTVGGKLLDKQGKPITLRLLACDGPPQGQKIGKLLTAWLQAIGIKVKFAYMTASRTRTSCLPIPRGLRLSTRRTGRVGCSRLPARARRSTRSTTSTATSMCTPWRRLRRGTRRRSSSPLSWARWWSPVWSSGFWPGGGRGRLRSSRRRPTGGLADRRALVH